MVKFEIDEQKMFEVFGCGEILNIAKDVLDRIDVDDIGNDYELYDAIIDAIDDECIYTYTQWEIMKHYQNPQDANFYDALQYFGEDLATCIIEK
jgi:hypothetical protein